MLQMRFSLDAVSAQIGDQRFFCINNNATNNDNVKFRVTEALGLKKSATATHADGLVKSGHVHISDRNTCK